MVACLALLAKPHPPASLLCRYLPVSVLYFSLHLSLCLASPILCRATHFWLGHRSSLEGELNKKEWGYGEEPEVDAVLVLHTS